MKKILFLVISLFLTANILLAEKDELITGSAVFTASEDDKGSVHVDEDIMKDYFSAGNSVSYKGIVDDLYMAGRRVLFDGNATGGVILFGDTVEINGDVDNNTHSAAGTLKVNGDLKDSAFLAGEEVVISESSTVDGTLFSASQTLTVKGKLNNGLYTAAGEVVIDGPVIGDVVVNTGKLIITERGSIDGNLEYSSGSLLSEKEKSRVTGEVLYKEAEHIEKEEFKTFFRIIKFAFVLSLAIAGLLLLLLPGIKSIVTRDREAASYGRTMLWGLIPVFIFPVLILVTIPLFPISIALGLSVFPLIGLTAVLGLALGGKFLFNLFSWKKDNIYLQFLFALAIYAVLMLIPVIKVITFLGATALGAGLIISKLFKAKF